MTTEQENKIIQQAQDIMARRFATQNELKLNAQSVAYYGAYYLGALQAVERLTREWQTGDWPQKKDKAYHEAFWRLITSSKRNMQMWLDGEEMRYRNHESDKKGRCIKCECYFVERRTLLIEKK